MHFLVLYFKFSTYRGLFLKVCPIVGIKKPLYFTQKISHLYLSWMSNNRGEEFLNSLVEGTEKQESLSQRGPEKVTPENLKFSQKEWSGAHELHTWICHCFAGIFIDQLNSEAQNFYQPLLKRSAVILLVVQRTDINLRFSHRFPLYPSRHKHAWFPSSGSVQVPPFRQSHSVTKQRQIDPRSAA